MKFKKLFFLSVLIFCKSSCADNNADTGMSMIKGYHKVLAVSYCILLGLALFVGGKELGVSSDLFYTIGSGIEKICQDMNYLPQYKYITVPIYKLFGGSKNLPVSVLASFISADVLMHRLLPEGVRLAALKTDRKALQEKGSFWYLKNKVDLKDHILAFVCWVGFGALTAYAKLR